MRRTALAVWSPTSNHPLEAETNVRFKSYFVNAALPSSVKQSTRMSQGADHDVGTMRPTSSTLRLPTVFLAMVLQDWAGDPRPLPELPKRR